MDATQPSWTTARKVAFRFFVVYFILYVLPFPFGHFTGVSIIWEYYNSWWYQVVPWVGKNILAMSYDITVFPNGSGDTTYNYVHVFTLAVISFLTCIIWTMLDRDRKNYSRLTYWILVGVRYYLAATMLGYGFAKVFHTQFAFPPILKLEQPLGDSSPMGLLWTFMGYSYGYSLFTGLGEVLGGMLLFFRRTVTTGSLLIFAIMVNVVILNFTFDVPVKLYSIHLTIMALTLILHDRKRVLSFILNKTSEPQWQRIDPPWLSNRKRVIVKYVFIIYFIGSTVIPLTDRRSALEPTPPRAALKGSYRIKEFSYNGIKEFQVLDTVAWKTLIIKHDGLANVISLSDHPINFSTKVDTIEKTIRFQTPNDRYELHYRKTGNKFLELWGPHMDFRQYTKRDSVRIKLEMIPKVEHLLVTRGFNWINEYPYNK
jgi:hypothetical protein